MGRTAVKAPPKVDYYTADKQGNVPPLNCLGLQYEHVPSGVLYTVKGFAYALDETWHVSVTRPGSAIRFTIPLVAMISGDHFRCRG